MLLQRSIGFTTKLQNSSVILKNDTTFVPYNCVFCAATFCVYILYRVLLRVQHFDSANNCDNSPGPVGRETGKLSLKVTNKLSEKHNSSKNSTSDYDRIIKRKASRYQLRFVNCPFHCLLQSI